MARKRKNKKPLFWGAYTVAGIKHLSEENELPAAAFQLLFTLIAQMSENSSYDNKVIVTQKKLSEDLGLAKSTVSKGIKSLIEKQYIVKITSGFMVSPHFFYIGKSRIDDIETLREEFNNKFDNPKYEVDEESNTLIESVNFDPEEESENLFDNNRFNPF